MRRGLDERQSYEAGNLNVCSRGDPEHYTGTMGAAGGIAVEVSSPVQQQYRLWELSVPAVKLVEKRHMTLRIQFENTTTFASETSANGAV
jgi:hypothetical protein